MAINQSDPVLNRELSSDFWWLKNANHEKFTEEYSMSPKKHVLVKKNLYKWNEQEFITRSGRLAEVRGSVSISKFQRILCVSFSRVDSELCTYHLFVWSNSNFLHNFQQSLPPSILFLR